jgi:oligoribonuclease
MSDNARFVWIDLEMTGLFPETDQILEIACIITDGNLNILEEGQSLVIHQPESVLEGMIDRVRQLHQPSGLIDAVRTSTIELEEAEQETLEMIQRNCERHRAILAGNSVWQDAAFMRIYMPRIMKYLHYRIVDVSSIKEVIKNWYPNDPHLLFEKKSNHRALGDIQESIAELKHYREYFFKSTE